MRTYKILKKGIFEGAARFEEKINQMAIEGWRAVSMAQSDGTLIVLFEREREY